MNKPKSKQPIPTHAKKVFEGVIFDVHQWEQEMFDGSKKVFEKIKRADTVDVIAITEEGRVMILEQEQPGKEKYFSLPGGRVENGEDPLECAKRELLEETGYACEAIKLWHAAVPSNKIDWVLYFYVAKNCKKVADQSLDGGEKIKVLTVGMEEFFDMVIDQKIKGSEIILKFLKENLLVINREESITRIKNHFTEIK